MNDPELDLRLAEWEFYYNWYRPHASLGGKIPMDRCSELNDMTPSLDEAVAVYDLRTEHERGRDHTTDMRLQELKRSG